MPESTTVFRCLDPGKVMRFLEDQLLELGLTAVDPSERGFANDSVNLRFAHGLMLRFHFSQGERDRKEAPYYCFDLVDNNGSVLSRVYLHNICSLTRDLIGVKLQSSPREDRYSQLAILNHGEMVFHDSLPVGSPWGK